MKTIILSIAIIVFFQPCQGQDFISYFTGDTTDVSTSPLGGVCMMGGATENDEAMKWFLERADGGDILVIRASGSDGYNNYLFSELGLTVNSVETIVFENKDASFDPYVLQQIQHAEAIWIAGGNQWNYVDYWRDTPLNFHINQNIQNKNMVIGGTSAGMAVLGSIYYSAEFNSLQSSDALNDPFHEDLTLSKLPFLQVPYLQNVVTDTHYDDPDRRGRHVTFLARAMKDWGIEAKGIACDEYTSVCVDTDGKAYVYGNTPESDDNAYFLQVNCVAPNEPEICEEGVSLHWMRNNAAIKVYRIKGESTGSKYLDLNNWEEGVGGVWQNWYVENGSLITDSGEEPDCATASTKHLLEGKITFFPNPLAGDFLKIKAEDIEITKIEIYDAFGKKILEENTRQHTYHLNFSNLPNGIYSVKVFSKNTFLTKKIVK